jgi:hypothetical protein
LIDPALGGDFITKKTGVNSPGAAHAKERIVMNINIPAQDEHKHSRYRRMLKVNMRFAKSATGKEAARREIARIVRGVFRPRRIFLAALKLESRRPASSQQDGSHAKQNFSLPQNKHAP